MNLQIRIQVPKSEKPYSSETDVDVITDPETVRAVLRAILEVEHRRARQPRTSISDPGETTAMVDHG